MGARRQSGPPGEIRGSWRADERGEELGHSLWVAEVGDVSGWQQLELRARHEPCRLACDLGSSDGVVVAPDQQRRDIEPTQFAGSIRADRRNPMGVMTARSSARFAAEAIGSLAAATSDSISSG